MIPLSGQRGENGKTLLIGFFESKVDVFQSQCQRELGRIVVPGNTRHLAGRPRRDERPTLERIEDAARTESQSKRQGERVGHAFRAEGEQRVVDKFHTRTRPDRTEPDRALPDGVEDRFDDGSSLL